MNICVVNYWYDVKNYAIPTLISEEVLIIIKAGINLIKVARGFSDVKIGLTKY